MRPKYIREDMSMAARTLPVFILGAFLLCTCTVMNTRSHLEHLEECENITKNVPASAPAYNMSGACYANIGYYPKAIEDFTRAIETDRNFTDAYYNRGLVFSKLNYGHMATQDMLDAVRLREIQNGEAH